MINNNQIKEIVWENQKPICNQRKCLIQQFFENEMKKPVWLRASSCLISCPCEKCSPRM